MCRVPEHVKIDVGNVANGGRLDVQVRFNAPYRADKGRYDCEDGTRFVVEKIKELEYALSVDLNAPFGFEKQAYCA